MANQTLFVTHQSALDCLPTEVIIEILRNLPEYYKAAEGPTRGLFREECRQLRALRLTHKRFANLDYINTILFTSIQLEPTRGSLTSLQRGDLSRVAKFVRVITFITPPSWMLPFETFEHITENPDDEDQANFSKTQLADGYAAYMCTAREAQALLDEEDGEVKNVWTEVLKTLGSRLRKIRLMSYRCDEIVHTEYFDTPSKTDQRLPCRLRPHRHPDHSHKYGCQYATAIAGDRLFVTVISCLAASGVTVPQITLKQNMTGTVKCSEIPGWEDLDLWLEKLKFCPEIPSNEHRWVKESVIRVLPCLEADEIEKNASSIVHDLVYKSHTTLQHLTLAGSGPMDWPTQPAMHDLPALQHLDQAFGSVNPYLLRDWIARMPMLRHLKLAECLYLSRGIACVDWRQIFDAIRDHPNVVGSSPKGIHVELDQIISSAWTEMSYDGVICRDGDIATERHTRNEQVEELMDVNLVLERHFYGETAFEDNHGLRYMLDDWDPDISESYSEDEDGEWTDID